MDLGKNGWEKNVQENGVTILVVLIRDEHTSTPMLRCNSSKNSPLGHVRR
jgi:hypothetical protein